MKLGVTSPAVPAPNGGHNSHRSHSRPVVRGKHLFVGGEKFYVRGVTYGTFAPDENGDLFPAPGKVENDFARMRAHAVNALRTYTVPPRWLLDCAHRHGLRVLVGLAWEQHIAFLEDASRATSIVNRVREGVRSCAGHPAILCYSIGNEIPASIVRWHGARRIERFLERLSRAVRAEDADGLVTYVNYPTTEYLQLPFLDLVSFNVYLESREKLEGYLARLHNLAGDRPLMMAELGLDSLRNGEESQAQVLGWQVRSAFTAGCAGLFVFAWTDEWHRGGQEVEDWDFGLTDRDRRPKPALTAVRNAFADVPVRIPLPVPRISVVVCCHNGQETLRDCLDGLSALDYPDFEVIVVDDGSRDGSAAIAAEYPFRLIRTPNRGLSNARNVGLAAATGDIVAYTDSDARADPNWLTYLANSFCSTSHAAIGGPNIPPAGDGLIAECVANAPGGPVHVLLSDTEAEHLPGVNMAFRRDCLEAIGGFDPQYCAAGDDVDVCWRLLEKGWSMGFSPSAVVWHHCRNSVRAYWKQQKGYGRAEAMLERKWPEKYNRAGHLSWSGRIYGKGLLQSLDIRRGRIYQGMWGSALFQSVYRPAPGLFSSVPMMPEWYVLTLLLGALSALGLMWNPLLSALPFFGVAVLASLIQAGRGAAKASFTTPADSVGTRIALYTMTGALHLLQPLARLWGRIEYGLTPWRRRSTAFAVPCRKTVTIWRDRWQAPAESVESLETQLRNRGAIVRRGGTFDAWDLEARVGSLGTLRLITAAEDHGAGKQLFRIRLRSHVCRRWGVAAAVLAALSMSAALSSAWVVSALLGSAAGWVLLRSLSDIGGATAAVLHSVQQLSRREERRPEGAIVGKPREEGAARRDRRSSPHREDRPLEPAFDATASGD
jgi:O-antigen biosynthesis protein